MNNTLRMAVSVGLLSIVFICGTAGAGPYLYIANSASASVTVVDTATGKVVIPTIQVGYNPGGMALTKNEDFLYVANANPASNSVSVIDASTHLVVKTIKVGEQHHVCVHGARNKYVQLPDVRCSLGHRDGHKQSRRGDRPELLWQGGRWLAQR